MNSTQLKLGLKVVATREFSGVPEGTKGEVIESSNSWPDTESVAIRWKRRENDPLVDWFSFDDLQYLEVEHRTMYGVTPLHVTNGNGVCIECRRPGLPEPTRK